METAFIGLLFVAALGQRAPGDVAAWPAPLLAGLVSSDSRQHPGARCHAPCFRSGVLGDTA
jgi:hypothetical protein